MENEKILENLGLSRQESQAYLALLRLGGSLASSVAKEMGVKRTTVYAILKSLAEKGLVLVYFRKNRKYYYAVQPNKVASIFERKLDAFNDLIPSLKSMEKRQEQIMGVRFIETKEELKEYFKATVEELRGMKDREYHVIANDFTWESIDSEFFKWYRKACSEIGVKVKLLFSYDSKENVESIPRSLQQYKFLPKQHVFTSSICIYWNRIEITSTELNSVAVIIYIKPIVDTFESIFKILWDILPEEKS